LSPSLEARKRKVLQKNVVQKVEDYGIIASTAAKMQSSLTIQEFANTTLAT
jgi:hypothetical protein